MEKETFLKEIHEIKKYIDKRKTGLKYFPGDLVYLKSEIESKSPYRLTGSFGIIEQAYFDIGYSGTDQSDSTNYKYNVKLFEFNPLIYTIMMHEVKENDIILIQKNFEYTVKFEEDINVLFNKFNNSSVTEDK